MRRNSRLARNRMRIIGTRVIYPKEMTDEISTARLRRPRDELRRRASRDGGARPEGGSARRQGRRTQGAHREVDRMLQGGRRQGPERQRAAEIPLRVQEREVVANSSVMPGHS